jgi:superfamily II DNA or RNA helicase
MLSILFTETANNLRSFLQKVLPSLDESWWKKYVLTALTFQQHRRVEEHSITNLSGLDLAALLRVLDKNWFEISEKATLPREARNWAKEMQTIRNRWAHLSNQEMPKEDIYRDLDTMQRFLEALKADSNLINKVREEKQTCFTSKQPAGVQPESAGNLKPQAQAEFAIGDIVILRAHPSISGAVINILLGKPENRYVIFHSGNTATYYASQLVRQEAPAAEQDIIVPLTEFHAYITALQLRHPGLANLYSLHAARVNYIPYQFKPVMKLIRSDQPRMLIADEVGVGKTIEAGLILRELQARRDINSVLIICPKPLVTERKWQKEMKRFDEHFEHLDGPTLRYCINETDLDGVWPEKYNKAILPFSLFGEAMLTGDTANRIRRSKGLFDLEPLPHFDLVIVDEAHHLRNTSTYVHNGVKFFCDNAEAVVFLTATPIQLGSGDLFVLLNLLRADLIIDQPSFEHMAGPNPYINRAIELARGAPPAWQEEAREALKLALDTPWGKSILSENPEFQGLYDLLNEKSLSPAESVNFVRDAEQLHTFSSIINRTRRRDIGNFTIRKPETVTVEFTPKQKALHDGILSIQARILARIHGDKNLKFMMTTIRRQAASCLFGLAPFLKEILTRRIDELEWEEADETAEAFDGEPVASIEGEIEDILDLVERLDSTDPKLEAVLKILRDKQPMPNNKVMLFSSFRHTLRYLHKHLIDAGLRVGLIHGGTPDEDRRELRDRFSRPKEIENALDILLSSEVGCEGLDYQFCDCMVNYDLPWNPMRVEQRIGRIDRYGQQSETVAIYNLVTPGTVDFDIYERCLWRIGVFRSAIGGNEEILGRITSEIHEVADNLTLTEDERKAKLQQISDNEIRLLKEQADLEEKQVELFGLRLPVQQTEEDVKRAASYWLSATSLQNLVRHYLKKTCGKEQEYILGEKPLKTLRLSQEARNILLEDFRKLPRKLSPIYREWERWLKGNVPTLSITFDAAGAEAKRETTFITPIHPLALQASQAIEEQQAVYTAFTTLASDIPSGSYPFAIYKWQKYGIREDVIFQPVCGEASLNESFFTLLEKAEQIEPARVSMPERNVFDKLDTLHHTLWSQARAEHQAHNLLLAQYRKESLQTSHKARLSILHDQLGKATDDKIRRMRQSEIARAEADFERRMAAIQKAETQADITAQAVAFGVMVVEGSAK